MSEPSLCTKPLIRLLREFCNTPLLKEFGSDAFGGGFVRDVLGAVFTKLKMRTLLIGLGPRATRTIHATWLIDFQ